MPLIFTPLQLLVAKHYDDGALAYCLEQVPDYDDDVPQLEGACDGLFEFVVNEAGDAGGSMQDYLQMLSVAINQLRSLHDALAGEQE